MFEDKTIVFISAVPWHGLYARPQQLSTRLVHQGARVLFVEPPWTLLSPLKRPELWRTWRLKERIKILEPRLAVYTPPPALPGYNIQRSVNRLNQQRIARWIKQSLEQLGWEKDIIWSHLPGTADWPVADSTPIIYECVDDHVAFGGLARQTVVMEMEDHLLCRAASVFATAASLLDRCRRVRPDTCLAENGADYDHFASAAGPADTERDLVVGFYGGIGPWIDLQLVFDAARRLPHAHFLMVGPLEGGVDIASAPPNVEFKGLLPYADLPDILAKCHVVMIPFKVNDITVAVNPIKLYEYFAAGRPVLVTPLPELKRHVPLVYVVHDAESFTSAVEAALTEDHSLLQRRQEVARNASWDTRLRLIERHFGGDKCCE